MTKELQTEFEATGYASWINSDLYPDGKIYTKEYTEWLESKSIDLTAENLRLREALERLPDEKEISQVAYDEMQQDWDDLRFRDVYKDGFIWGAIWMKRKAEQALK